MAEIDAPTKKEIRNRARLVLSDAGFKAPPVDVDVLIDSLRLFKGYYDLQDPGFCRTFAHRFQVGALRIRQITSKINLKALLLQKENRIVIDSSLHELRKTWAAYHETVHKILPWHKAFYIGDTAQTLDPYYQERLDQEANFGASDLMFCGTAFSKMALDTKPHWNSIKLLSKQCRTSYPTTLRRYVEHSHDLPMAALVSTPFWAETAEDHPNRWRHFPRSKPFRNRFSRVTPEDVLGIVDENTNRRRGGIVGEYEMILSDDNGTFHIFNVQSFFNQYDLLTFIVYDQKL